MKLNNFFNTVFLIIINFICVVTYTYFINNYETIANTISNITSWEYLGLMMLMLLISFKNVDFTNKK